LLTTLFGLGGISREFQTRSRVPGPHVRLNAGWSLADDIAVLRPGCPLGDGDPPDPFVLVDAYDFYKRGALCNQKSMGATPQNGWLLRKTSDLKQKRNLQLSEGIYLWYR